MNKFHDFRLVERDPNYDKVRNPKRLTVKELLPVGASWKCDGKLREVLNSYGVLAVPLSDSSGIAIVEGPFETEPENRAYVVNEFGNVRYKLSKPSKLNTSSFSDVYYVEGELCFFLSGPSGDFRLSVNEIDGVTFDINPSR